MKWFKNLSEVKGVEYKSPTDIDYAPIEPLRIEPQVDTFDSPVFGDKTESLMWPMGEGTTSQAPASQWANELQNMQKSSASNVLSRLHQALSLPGEPADYHFAIAGCVKELWRRRRDEPEVFSEIENLCWLDIRLIQALPNTVREPTDKVFYRIEAFHWLISLYEQQGSIREAIDVAKIASKYDQQQDKLQQLRERLKDED